MKKVLRFLTLVAMLCIPWVTQAQLTLTVHDGSATSSYVPVYGLWADAYLKCEFVVPATELSEMTGGTISQMDFYLTSPAAAAWTGTFQVFIKEVTSATLDAYSGTTGATVVYEGTLDATASTMSVVFSTEYTYGGGNLLVGVYQAVKGNYKSATFAGESVTGASGQGYSSSSLDGVSFTQRNFIPKTTFTYTPPSTGCDMPTSIAMGTITHNSAVVTWEGTGTTFDLQYKKATDVDYTLVENVTSPYTLTSLDGNTAYNVGVRTVCGGTTSYFRSTSFTTANPCAAPTNFEATGITTNSATLSWTAGYQETSWTVKYKKASEAWDDATTVTGATNSLDLTGLDPLTTYNVRVYNCTGDSDPYLSGNFTTAVGIPVIEAFSTTSLPTGWTRYSGLVNDVIAGTATLSSISSYWNFGTNNNVFDSHARLNIYGTGCKYWLATPAIPMEDNVQLTFDMALTKYSGTLQPIEATLGEDDRFLVLVSTDNMATWSILREWNNTGSADVYNDIVCSATGQPVAIDLSSYAGQNVILAFYGESTVSETGSDNNLHIDNVRVDYIPSCAIPTALAKDNVTAHTVDLAWTAGGTETAWVVAYKASTDADFTEENVSNPTYTLTGLAPETAYTVKVRANCGGAYSDWTNTISFTTAVACTAPTSLTRSNLTGHGVTYTWAEVEGATFQYGYAPTASYDVNAIAWQSTNSNTVTLSGLDPETGYTFALRKDCTAASDGYSQVVTQTFTTTVACPAPTVAVSNITTTTADVSCSNTEATSFNVMLGDVEVATGVSMPYTLTGLTENTSYTVKVKAICGGSDGESAYSGGTNFMTAEVCPTGMVCIGTGTSTSNYVPANNYYNYSLTEQIYTAAEIGMAGQISSIEFYKASTITMEKNLVIYMVSTTKDEFTSTSDWIPVTASDIVYSGTVTFVDNAWTTIDLQTPFNYDGTSNLCIVVDNNTGDYESNTAFRVFTAAKNQALYYQSDGTNLDPTTSLTTSGSRSTSKNRIRITIGEPPTCAKPTGVTVNYTGGTTATVSWTSTESNFNIDVNGTVTNNVTSPYNLTGLSLATTYNVMVQADCGSDGTSDWTSPVSFTTDLCLPADQCEITFELTDSWGDGWNGAYIEVVDVLTSTTLAEMANENLNGTQGSGENELNTLTLAVCNGRDIQFVWHTGNYDSEASYVVKDVNGEEIFSGSGAMSSPVDYTVNCTLSNCKTPTGLTVDNIGNHSAELSWTENGVATAWKVAYKVATATDFTEVNAPTNPYTLTGLDPETDYIFKVRPVCDDAAIKWSAEETFTTDIACPVPTNLTVTPAPFSAEVNWTGFSSSYTLEWSEAATYTPSTEAAWLQYDDGTYVTGIGNTTSQTWTWGVMYPASMLGSADVYLNKIAVYEYATYWTSDYTVSIYAGGDAAPGTLVGTQTVTPMGADGLHEIMLNNPVTLDHTQNLWITLTVYGGYVMSACNTTEVNNQWVYDGASWDNIGNLASSLAGYGWMIRGLIDNTAPTYSWNTETGVTSPHTITGLDAESDYTVRVKADCGSDGESNWTYASFTTLSNCAAPNALTADDVTATTATLGWTGYQEAFNVRYRTAPVENPTFFDDFESGLTQWTTVANDYDASGTNWRQFDGSFTTPIPAHGGTYMAMSRSYDGSDQSVDNWLISPQVTLDGTLRFWARNDDGAGYAEHYEIYVSTTTNDISNFTSIYVPADADDWTEYSVDLSSYAGALGYIAIRHNDYGQDFLLIDDFGIYAASTPAGAWVEVNGVAAAANPTANTINVTGLTPGTDYEFQVQGVYTSCTGGVTDWSSMATFTTMEEATKHLDAEQWYLLSAPLANQGDDETVDAVSELISHTYDLYRFDEPSGVWENYDAHSGDFTTLEQGRGYLYRNTSDVDITFVGVRRTGDIDYDLSYSCPDPDLMGFNLVGNPYMHCIALSGDFYTLNTDGVWEIQSGGGNIGVAEGALVQTDVVNDIVPFEDMACSKSARSKASATAGLAFTVTDGRYTDMAYARFENGTGLKKINHLNNEAPMMSIPVDGRNYAIANLDESTESFPLNFNGKGEYTLQVATNGATFGYLHLIDKEAGKDIDLLRQPLYTFKSNGSTDRFTVVLSSDGNQSGFVHVSGNSVIVDGEGDLQVFDVMGRQMGTMHVDGSTTLDRNALGMVHAGVYVLRLNGNSQKIVVK